MLELAAGAQRAKRDIGDRFVGASKENVENRQSTVQFLRLKIDLHVFGDEEAEAKRGVHCFLQIVQRITKIRHVQRVRRRPHRFLATKNVDVGFRKELIDVEKIRSAKHVERDRNLFA